MSGDTDSEATSWVTSSRKCSSDCFVVAVTTAVEVQTSAGGSDESYCSATAGGYKGASYCSHIYCVSLAVGCSTIDCFGTSVICLFCWWLRPASGESKNSCLGTSDGFPPFASF